MIAAGNPILRALRGTRVTNASLSGYVKWWRTYARTLPHEHPDRGVTRDTRELGYYSDVEGLTAGGKRRHTTTSQSSMSTAEGVTETSTMEETEEDLPPDYQKRPRRQQPREIPHTGRTFRGKDYTTPHALRYLSQHQLQE